ncbi:TraI domain-containing protein [Enterobacter sp. CFBP8995]|nr:TraI domain-containing protein [Enterobacter sp. CFBP8995]
MFPKLQNRFRRSNFQPSLPVKREGYFTPQNHQLLLGTPVRQALLKKIWQSSLLSKSAYDEFCLQPLQTLAERYQNLSAVRIGGWNVAGGLLDLTLQQIITTLQLSKGMVFPANAAPEDQAAQSSHWNCVVFWLALYWHVPELLCIEAELEDGQIWYPLSNAPGMQYRFKVNPQPELPAKDNIIRLAFAASMLPKSAINWMEKLPNVRDCLFLELAGINSTEKQIHSLLNKVRSKLLSDELNEVKNIAKMNTNLHLKPVSELPAGIPTEQYDDAVYEQYFSQVDVNQNNHLTNDEIEISADDFKENEHGSDISEIHIQNGSRINANKSENDESSTYGSSESEQNTSTKFT